MSESESLKALVESIIEEEMGIERALRDKQIEFMGSYNEFYDTISKIINERGRLVHEEIIKLHELARLASRIEPRMGYAQFLKREINRWDYKSELQAWAEGIILRDLDINRRLANMLYEYADDEQIYHLLVSVISLRALFVNDEINYLSELK